MGTSTESIFGCTGHLEHSSWQRGSTSVRGFEDSYPNTNHPNAGDAGTLHSVLMLASF